MENLKIYIIIDENDKYYPYHVTGSKFTSDINLATLRPHNEAKLIVNMYISSTTFSNISITRKLKIENIRKLKLEILNNLKNEFI